ncbi:MAG TPA: MarR family winged helix-turn-helix transcriptional regulator [Candidatus Limnocylindrales bacterium]|jgi:DNA-binding MarR family transcriptional regulator
MSTASPVAGAPDGSAAPRGIDDHIARVDPRLVPWVVFLRAHAAVSRALEAELEAEQAMSLADYEALIQLAHADGRRLRMSELADRMILTRSGISRLVDRLEHEHYVQRVACSTDARGAYAMLTDAGYARLQAATPTHLRGVESHFLSAIPSADRAAFVRVLNDILDGLERPDRVGEVGCPD